MTITPEEVAKLAADATPGPWKVVADETAAQVKGFPRIEAEDYEIVGIEGMYGDYETDWANAAFIAAAHDMADLIARQDEAHAENARILGYLVNELQGLVPAGKLAALDQVIAEAKAEGMREAADKAFSMIDSPWDDYVRAAIRAAADAIQKEGGA